MIAVAGFSLAAYVAWALRRKLERSSETRFFALGMLLSLAPIAATFPANRLLLFTGLGAFGIVAPVIGDLRVPAPADAPRALRRVWIALHLVLAPLLLPGAALAIPAFARWVAPTPSVVSQERMTSGSRERTVVLVNVPTILAALPWMSLDPGEAGRRVRVLSGTTGQVAITREGVRTLLVELAPGAETDAGMALFRDDAHPLHAGKAYDVPGLHAEVVRLGEDDWPAAVRYEFDRDLDDASFRWVGWDGAYADFAPPAIGGRMAFGAK